MSAVGSWPVIIIPFGGAACATLLWQLGGRTHVTAVVKARFRIRHGRPMAQLLPEPIDHRRDELAPHVPEAEVLVTSARAYSPVPVEVLAVRLRVVRDEPLVDKSLLVYAPRPEGQTRPFTSATLVDPHGERPEGLVIDPDHPDRRASFAPLAADHPDRLAPLAHHSRPDFAAEQLELGVDFPWSYFQAAPHDQRCDALRGDEWLLLEGMTPEGALASRLPDAHAEVRVYPPGLRRGHAHGLSLRADRLSVDAERQSCTLSWRGSFAVADPETARRLVLVGGVTLGEHANHWPTRRELNEQLKRREPGLPASAYATTNETEGGLEALLAQRHADLDRRARAMAARFGARRIEDDTTETFEAERSMVAIDHAGNVHLLDDEGPKLTEKGTWEMAPGERAEDELAPLDGTHALRALALDDTDASRPTELPPSTDQLPDVAATDVDDLEDTLSESWHQLDASMQDALQHLRGRKKR